MEDVLGVYARPYELLTSLSGIQETVLIYPTGNKGRPEVCCSHRTVAQEGRMSPG